MVSPVSTTEDDPQARRKAVILQELSRISKQQKITLDGDVISLQNLVEDTVGEAQRLSKRLDKRRATRTVFGKSGNALQKFTSTFSQFLKAYPGISDLSKGANAHYGGMVVGTLSLLFQIGENKEGRETAINSSLKELTRSWIGDMGRLKQYSEALPASPKMDEFIADVYLGIGELAMDAVKYYLRPSYARFWQAIRRPPQLYIDLKVEGIKKAVFEVVLEGNVQLVHSHFKEVDLTRERAKVTQKQIECLLEEAAKWRAQVRKDKIEPIVRRLGLDWDTAATGNLIAKCQSLHANAFVESVRRRGSKKLQQISLELVQDSDFYKQWNEATGTSILILSGSNFDDYQTGHLLCWLSPITTEVAEEARRTTSKTLFFSACPDEASRRRNLSKKEPLADCFSHLISQMLHWDDTDYVESICQWVGDDVNEGGQRRQDTLRRLLGECQCSDQVYIIIDRLDRIAPLEEEENDDDDEDEEGVSSALEAVLDTVSAASCTVKLLITVHADRWSRVKNDEDMERRWKIWRRQFPNLERCSMFCKVGWRQPEAKNP